MAHLHVAKEYMGLQKRLDRDIIGAPSSKELYEILRILYSEEEAEIGSLMPMKPSTLQVIARRVKRKKDELKKILERMADKGLVMDFVSHKDEKEDTYYILAPPVVGFFEFSLMRRRSDIDQKKLSEHYHKYLYEDEAFVKQAFQKETQLGRVIAHEDTIRNVVADFTSASHHANIKFATTKGGGDISVVLSYELATELIKESKKCAVSLCYCRHKSLHLGTECKYPMEICTTLNSGAEWAIRRKFGREVSKEELLQMFEESRELGLVHIADNVQNKPSFVCHCCACCCGFLVAFNKLKIHNCVMTSNFIMKVDEEKCKGCGACAKRCPVNAIEIIPNHQLTITNDGVEPSGSLDINGAKAPTPNRVREKEIKKAKVDSGICLGCGVCIRSCKVGAASMLRRKPLVITPENTIDRVIRMAIERGKVQELIFDDYSNITHVLMNKVIKRITKLPPVEKFLLSEQVRSRFVKKVIKESEGIEI